MKQQIQIRIAEPCHENWNSMSPTDQGRFCMSCQKQVVDFSTMTDKEILEHISAASKSICGRAGNDQLNRLLVAPPEPRKIWWRYWMGLAASLVLISSKASAQTKSPSPGIVQQDPVRMVGKIAVLPEPEKANKYVVNGVIKDEFNQPVIAASIMIKDTKKGVVSDSKGMFSIQVDYPGDIVLRISSVGYEMQDVKVTHPGSSQIMININMVLKQTLMGMVGEVVVVKKKKKSWLNYLKKDTVASCVSPVSKQTISIYPNPVVKGTEIKMKINNLPQGKYRLSFIDLMGNEVAEKEISITANNAAATLACDQRFVTGMYVVNLTGNGKTISSKCIVQ